MDDLEHQLQSVFLDEATELLDETEQCFLAFEDGSAGPETLNQVFRLAHNFKGSAAAVGFADIATLTHELESVVIRLRGGELPVTQSLVSAFLAIADQLRQMVSTLKTNRAARFDTTTTIGTLKAAATEAARGAGATASEDSTPASDQGYLIFDQGSLPAPEQQAARIPAASTPEPASLQARQPARKNEAGDAYVRVSLGRLDRLMNDIGELVIL